MAPSSFIEARPDALASQAEGADRRADEELRRVASHARCLLWHGEVTGLPGWERAVDDHQRQLLVWKIEVQDENAAQLILPLEVLPGECYFNAWARSRLPEDDLQMWIRASTALVEGKPGYSQEFRCRDKYGNVRWQSEDVALQRLDHDRWRAFSVVTDITERKQTERELQKAKENAEAANLAKDRFLAMLSHELRTPLTPVLATINLVESRTDLPEDLRADLGTIRQNVEMEARLIDDLLDLTRVNRGKVELRNETVDAHTAIESALRTCGNEAEAKKLTVTLKLEASRHHVWADAARLQQVFWNLLKNAIKFTPANGRVDVRSCDLVQNDGSHVLQVEVIDNGIGIDPEMLPRLFDEFEQGERTITRQFGGLGLGLAISRALMHLQRGTLTASSEGAGRGATFRVTMPVTAQPAQTAAPQPTSPVNQPTGSATILLVDDHADTLRIMSRLLGSVGYKILTADSVASSLAMAADHEIDLLISDLGLPDGSGLDIMQQLRQRSDLPPMRGIALSGYGMDEDICKSIDAGFARHLTKPVSFRLLAETIRQVLGS